MDIYQLLAYDEWATSKLLEAVTSLSPEQFAHEFTGSLSSVRQQFAHLLSVEDRYRARLAHEVVPDVSPESFITPQELVAYAVHLRCQLNSFINGLEESDLTRIEEHATRRGVFWASVEQTLIHMVNHATYHRGQIACLLKLHDIDFSDTDFIIWLKG